eukprot:CAMPEP_0196209236 /NCGR_PEP_ID=MMETSP0912-20130531/9531_1 /TAXON_ID=49265 /ORGANISM="Thalassiosira rotula, Strain GSO102" /LENGTH=92 /DNA_ID=CAMNT_0041484125 /DNA_START=484 /DNA_END=759 /DNA_ORIENTATION=+
MAGFLVDAIHCDGYYDRDYLSWSDVAVDQPRFDVYCLMDVLHCDYDYDRDDSSSSAAYFLDLEHFPLCLTKSCESELVLPAVEIREIAPLPL